ncbi:hypothetical protein [Bradyrhizobium liaoningense]
MSETKKRLLISKWHDGAKRSEIERRMERLLFEVDTLNSAVGKLNDQDEEIETLKSDLEERDETIKELESERDARDDAAYGVLEDVKYWLHSGLVHHRLVSDPRQMLRKVEEVLR